MIFFCLFLFLHLDPFFFFSFVFLFLPFSFFVFFSFFSLSRNPKVPAVTASPLLQEGQNLLRTGVCLRQYRDTSLLQNLGLGEFRSFSCEVCVQDTAVCSAQVFRSSSQIRNCALKAVLNSTQICAN